MCYIAGLDLSDAHLTMVSIDHVAHKVLTYIPYVLVLIDLRYEGKELNNVILYLATSISL